MKHIILYLSLLFLLTSNKSFGQCLLNGDFEQLLCPYEIYDCPTFEPACVVNWRRSHGTPQIKTFQNGKPKHTAYMWAQTLIGEGIFASYNFFARHTYKVTLSVLGQGNTGNFQIFGANNMVQSVYDGCGDYIPTVSSKQLITTQTAIINSWQSYTISFTPNSDYNQIWIYPTTTSSTQFDFYVEYIEACPDCQGIINYNIGTLPPGNTKAGFIYAGSSVGVFGAGTVINNPSAVTSLQATTTIYFKREFHASVSTGTFSAKIIACSGLNSRMPQVTQSTISDDKKMNRKIINADVDSNGIRIITEKNILINPIPSNGVINISGDNELKNSTITISDQSGRIVGEYINKSKDNVIQLDLHYLSNGMYYVKIYMLNKVVTQKIIINK